MFRLCVLLVALCGLVSATPNAGNAQYENPIPTVNAGSASACFESSNKKQVEEFSYGTAAITPGVSSLTSQITPGTAPQGCSVQAALTGHVGLYVDRVWAITRSGAGVCLDTTDAPLSTVNIAGASVSRPDLRPSGSDQMYQLLLTRELFGCQYDSNANNGGANQAQQNSLANRVTAWRGERWNIYRNEGYNSQSFKSITGTIGAGFFTADLSALTWDNPTNDGVATINWDSPFAADCSLPASGKICPAGTDTGCVAGLEIANVACATSSALLAYSAQTAFQTYKCGIADAGGLTGLPADIAPCVTRQGTDAPAMTNAIWGSQGIFTFIQNNFQPKITQFSGAATNGWGLDTSKTFYLSDNKQITVQLSGTANTPIQGRTGPAAFNNQVFIANTVDVDIAAPTVTLKQLDYSSSSNQATFRASDGKCVIGQNGAPTQCGGATGFTLGQQYWAKVQSSFAFDFTAACQDVGDITCTGSLAGNQGCRSYPYLYSCNDDFTIATTARVFNTGANQYPTVKRTFSAQLTTDAKQVTYVLPTITYTAVSDPVYLGFFKYAGNAEFDVANNWVAQTIPGTLATSTVNHTASLDNPAYWPDMLSAETFVSVADRELLENNRTNQAALDVARQTNAAKQTLADNANSIQQTYYNELVKQGELRIANEKLSADNADKRAENYNYAVGLLGAGVVVFAVFFILSVGIVTAAYLKVNK